MLEPNIIDGFCYLRRLRCNFTHLSLAVEQFEALRRAGAYKQKQWCIPEDTSIVINASESYEIQVDVGVGAVIWGYTFSGQNSGDLIRKYAYQVRDSCNDVSLFSEYATNQFSLWNGDRHNSGGGQTLLSKLYTVGAPGLLTVEISNGYPLGTATADTGPAQLIIFGGVPDRG